MSAGLDTPISPPLTLQIRAWLAVGLQSFGGGMATLALIHRAFVDKRKWISEEEFTQFWAIGQVAPGINLLSFAILIGRRLEGTRGSAAALFGLLLPSVAVTILMTAAYSAIRDSANVQAALHAVIPTTVGIGLATAVKMAVPLLKSARRAGSTLAAASLLILAVSGASIAAIHAPVIVVLILAGAAGALSFTLFGVPAATDEIDEIDEELEADR